MDYSEDLLRAQWQRELSDAYERGYDHGRDEAFEEARGAARIAKNAHDAERRIIELAARPIATEPGA